MTGSFTETTNRDAGGIVISEDAARGGVVGHNVRYVLAWGLMGVTIVFAGIAAYFGHAHLQAALAEVLAKSPWDIAAIAAPYAALILFGMIAVELLLGLWNILAGRSDNESQAFMRARVVVQLVLIAVIMTMFYITAT